MANYLILHGPNLNLLGQREPEIYGDMTLKALDEALIKEASPHQLFTFQSNAEHELMERVQSLKQDEIEGVVFNPAAFTHTSVAIRDAFSAVLVPFIEVHISNVYAREPFRKTSYFSDIAKAVITGFGVEGYFIALKHLIN